MLQHSDPLRIAAKRDPLPRLIIQKRTGVLEESISIQIEEKAEVPGSGITGRHHEIGSDKDRRTRVVLKVRDILNPVCFV